MISPRRLHRNTNHTSSIQDTGGSRTAIIITGEKIQTPPDLVVNFQPIDITEVIL